MSVTSQDLETFEKDCKGDLLDIKESLNAFNIFNVLGIQFREIRHSNFLGWLFDPNESHQLGDVFLKSLFKVIKEVGVFDSAEYEDFLLFDVSNTMVYRESIHNIDILIVNKEHGFVITIENKIHANYSQDQLSKYYKYVEENYSEFGKHIYLTLTPNRSESHKGFPDGKNYTNINYQHIIELLETNRPHIDSAIATVKESINQYIAMVQKDITKTSKEVVLAQKIYKQYKREIDFIISNQEDFSVYKNVVYDFIKNSLEGFVISHDSSKRSVIYVLPDNEELLKLFRFEKAKSRGGDYIFSLVIYFEQNAVWMKFGFGNIVESEDKEAIQIEKVRLFNEMQTFQCLDKKINSFIDPHIKNTPEMEYASICGVPLFNDVAYYESDKSFLELFKSRFETLNKDLIQPWIEECLDKLK